MASGPPASHTAGPAVSLHIAHPLPARTLARLADDVCAWLHEVDRRFSPYKEDSEVNQVHRGELEVAAGSADLRAVLDTCADLWRATDGYFDLHSVFTAQAVPWMPLSSVKAPCLSKQLPYFAEKSASLSP